jgi:hypothetical protein
MLSGALVLCAAVGLSACATWRDNVQSQFGTAKTAIDAAKAAGAQRYAPETIKSAESYLAQAQTLLGAGQYQGATRSIQQAVAGAQLAKVQAESGAKNAQVESLRQEIAGLMK